MKRLFQDLRMAAAANDTPRVQRLLASLSDKQILSPTLRRRLRVAATQADAIMLTRELVDEAEREVRETAGRAVVALTIGAAFGGGLGYMVGRRGRGDAGGETEGDGSLH